jgi:hypothetical protein
MFERGLQLYRNNSVRSMYPGRVSVLSWLPFVAGLTLAAVPSRAQTYLDIVDTLSRRTVNSSTRQVVDGYRPAALSVPIPPAALPCSRLEDPQAREALAAVGAIRSAQELNRMIAVAASRLSRPISLCFEPRSSEIDEKLGVLLKVNQRLYERSGRVRTTFTYIFGWAQSTEAGASLPCDRAGAAREWLADHSLEAVRWERTAGRSNAQVYLRRVIFRGPPSRDTPEHVRASWSPAQLREFDNRFRRELGACAR